VRTGNGSYTITTTEAPKVPGARPRVTSVSGDENIPVNVLLVISASVAALMASLLGLTLSRENDGHLELAWTKPASRDQYALATMATGAAAVLIAGAMMLAAIFLAFAIMGGITFIHADGSTLPTLLFCAVFPLSLYALIAAATASLRRGAVVLAVFWPAALILPTLSNVSLLNLGSIIRILDVLNPVAYLYAFNSESVSSRFLPIPSGAAYEICALALLAALCLAASLAQWRHLEA
jgi:hypothetical protein